MNFLPRKIGGEVLQVVQVFSEETTCKIERTRRLR